MSLSYTLFRDKLTSTFINALLKEEVLPSGVLQNTKAIIEIEKPKEDENGRKYIKVVWGNKDNEGKNVETIFESENKEDLNNELKKIAAVDTKYRDIPTTVIDGYLLNDIAEIPIEALEREGEYSSLTGKESLIKSYIEEYKDKSKIPVEIHFVYPLQYSFSDLVVVDSPGVNARGGIQRRTRESIYRANAIIFVRSLETPAEHTSFREFYREVIPDRPKETLFLVFTKAQDKDELDLKKDEIREDISEISEEKIIGVDSLCRLLQFELEKYKTPDELIDTYKKQKTELSEQLNKASNDTKKELREKIVVINNKLKILESIPFKENKNNIQMS
ncbi:MAG: dynamin family protein [Ignavibacterium sp.]|nr:dynamin family protein [Ignavibacterium sp.]